ncbi:MAG: ABC transporter substrate-binding protein [Spirochaetales bacterium]|nr:ABC transporter substrate-binding protein [Spirochaetales bacterium]
MAYFEKTSTLWDITEEHPRTIPVFTSNGFDHMGDEAKRAQFGKAVTLETALMLKQLDYETFSRFLTEAIEGGDDKVDLTLGSDQPNGDSELKVVGLLPCPVRLPLMEQFSTFLEEHKDITINHELKAASMGLDWVENNLKGIKDASELPDLFISAGFDMFFDEKMIGRFKKEGVFEDLSGLNTFNSAFDGLDLKDPRGHYSLISVVPAVFLVNTDELATLGENVAVPKTWEDIMDPIYENRISLPVGDFDLFNGILLNIHKKYGDEGVARLGKNLLESLHPSQMVKSDRKKDNKPVVTIMPYFFTKMTKIGGVLETVWPEDGAIISPIFMLSKKEKAGKLQPVIDFFASPEVGTVLAHNGLFPTVLPDIDNRLPQPAPFMWLGWDYIYSNDIARLISHCEEVFNKAVEEDQ